MLIMTTRFAPLRLLLVLLLTIATFPLSALAEESSKSIPPLVGAGAYPFSFQSLPLDIVGVSVVPHTYSKELKYFRSPKTELGALVRIFVRHRDAAGTPLALELSFNGKSAQHWVDNEAWTWYESPDNRRVTGSEYTLGPGKLDVFTFNAMEDTWSEGKSFRLGVRDGNAGPEEVAEIALSEGGVVLRQVSFPGGNADLAPSNCAVHIENGTELPVRAVGIRFHVPGVDGFATLRDVTNLQAFSSDGAIPSLSRGGFTATFEALPLVRGLVEVVVASGQGDRPHTLWAPIMFKVDRFNIGSGWLNTPTPQGVNPMTQVPFLQLLQRLHVDTAYYETVPGYNAPLDAEALYNRFPLRMMSELGDVAKYNADEWLPRIHAVDCLGEPQMGTSAMDSFRRLQHYADARYPTSITLSEDKGFREYAGLSDFPHFDAYRVSAPAADTWIYYDRWEDGRVPWGAPLEGIGEMMRTIHSLSRPKPVAIWSQNVHEGWKDQFTRTRKSPTADEIYVQAYEALANGVMSLYWYSLQSDSVITYRDTLQTTARIGREIRMLQDLYLRADAYHHERLTNGGRPDWDLNVLAAPDAAILFAIDLAYRPDREKRVFVWEGPRSAELSFPIPSYVGNAGGLFRVDADGTHDVAWEITGDKVLLRTTVDRGSIFVMAKDAALRGEIDRRCTEIKSKEAAVAFDPISLDSDFALLQKALGNEATN